MSLCRSKTVSFKRYENYIDVYKKSFYSSIHDLVLDKIELYQKCKTKKFITKPLERLLRNTLVVNDLIKNCEFENLCNRNSLNVRVKAVPFELSFLIK